MKMGTKGKNELENLKQALGQSSELFKMVGIGSPLNEAEILLSYILQLKRSEIYLNLGRVLSTRERKKITRAIQKRLKNIPLQYITGHQEFMGMDFLVEPGVLIPRPETEILVERVIERLKNKKFSSPLRVVDLGTGSGVIAISLAKFIKGIIIYAIDLSKKSLILASKNASRLVDENRIIFLYGDLFKPLKEEKIDQNSLDGIISNPPYVNLEDFKSLPREIRENEPKRALYGGVEGMDFYPKIIRQAPYFLKKGGFLALEGGAGQAPKIKELILKEGHYKENIEIFEDYSGIERVVIAYRK